MGISLLTSCFFTLCFAKVCETQLFAGLWTLRTTEVSRANLGSCFITQLCDSFGRAFLASPVTRIAKMGNSQSFKGLRSCFLTTMCLSNLLTMFGGILHSQARAGSGSKIKALLPKRTQFAKPVLFTSSQKLRKQHQFENFKEESGFTILIESILQFGVAMRSEEHTSELQSPDHLVCRLLLEKKKTQLSTMFP